MQVCFSTLSPSLVACGAVQERLSLEAGRLTFSDAFSSAGSSEDRSRHMGMRGSHGISIRALPKGSSLTRPTTAPRFLEGCSIATTLAHARSSGR